MSTTFSNNFIGRAVLASVLAAIVAMAAFGVTRADAHTTVQDTRASSNKVSVTFNGAIRRGSIKVTNSRGGTVSKGNGGRDPRNVKRISVPLKNGLRSGTYRAKWKIVAIDGHTQTGSFRFRL